MHPETDALRYFRSRFVLESRLAQLPPPIDGVTTAVDDALRWKRSRLRSRRKC
jgi:citrate lyase subunit beta / citryl-CoA lyase